MNAHSTTLISDSRETLTNGRSRDLVEEYASLIKRYVLLEQPREQQLARRWQEHRDRSATDALVTSHLRLAAKVARRYQRYDLPLADLIGEANLGLVIAASHFEPGRGARFSTYALWWIKARSRLHPAVAIAGQDRDDGRAAEAVLWLCGAP
jgi:RNA polymerase sigma-32 factor